MHRLSICLRKGDVFRLITENVSTLKMHKLTEEQYNRELENGNIEENAIYLTPEVERIGDLTQLKTNAKGSVVEAINELYDLIKAISN